MPYVPPPRLAPFFDEFDAIAERQEILFEGGSIGIAEPGNPNAVAPEVRGDLEIFAMNAEAPGHGWGKAMLSLVVALADKHGLSMQVTALATEDDPEEAPGQADLEAFYAKHGFLDRGTWSARHMYRPAAPLNEESLRLLRRAIDGDPLWTSRNPVPAGG